MIKLQSKFRSIIVSSRIKIREFFNLYLGWFRRNKLNCPSFTIISNNCWGGHVYRYFNLPYNSPTIGLYFFSEDYIRFVTNLNHYLCIDLKFISFEQSKHRSSLENSSAHKKKCPIGVLDDIEIIFLHYSSQEEAYEKWNRRKNRIDYEHLFFKMSEQNECSIDLLRKFDNLPYANKFVFTTADYGLKSQIVFYDFINCDKIVNDTNDFRKYISLENWINGNKFKKHQKQ